MAFVPSIIILCFKVVPGKLSLNYRENYSTNRSIQSSVAIRFCYLFYWRWIEQSPHKLVWLDHHLSIHCGMFLAGFESFHRQPRTSLSSIPPFPESHTEQQASHCTRTKDNRKKWKRHQREKNHWFIKEQMSIPSLFHDHLTVKHISSKVVGNKY